MQISLPQSITGIQSTPSTCSYALNMYPIDGVLVDRSPWAAIQQLPENGAISNSFTCRGLVVSADGERLYGVFGNTSATSGEGRVYRLDSSGDVQSTSYSQIGTVSGVSISRMPFAVGFNEICFSTGTKKYYIDTSNDTVTEITDADLPDCTDVDFVDGRYLWTATDGESIHYSDVNAPATISATSFFDAETRPDSNRKTAIIGNDIFVFGDRSIERFRSTGSSTAPFVRVSNSIYSVGYIGGIKKLSDRVFFVGAPIYGSPAVYELSLQGLRQISPTSVNEQIFYGESSYTSGDSYIDSWHEFGRQILHCRISVDTNNERSFYCVIDGGAYKWGYLDAAVSINNDGGGIYQGLPIRKPIADFDLGDSVLYKGDYYASNNTFKSAVFGISGVAYYLNKMRPNLVLNEALDGSWDSESGSNGTVDVKYTRGFVANIRGANDNDLNIDNVRLSVSPITTSASTSHGTSGDTSKIYLTTDLFNSGTAPTAVSVDPNTTEFSGGGRFHTKRELNYRKHGGLLKTNRVVTMAFEIESNQRIAIEGGFVNDSL